MTETKAEKAVYKFLLYTVPAPSFKLGAHTVVVAQYDSYWYRMQCCIYYK
jgi:hypothetical protein